MSVLQCRSKTGRYRDDDGVVHVVHPHDMTDGIPASQPERQVIIVEALHRAFPVTRVLRTVRDCLSGLEQTGYPLEQVARRLRMYAALDGQLQTV